MPIIYRANFFVVHHDPIAATLETEWLAFTKLEPQRSSLQQVLRLGGQLRVQGWISNKLKMRSLGLADQALMNQEWFPEFAKLGIQRLAIVVSEDALQMLSISDMMQRAIGSTPFDTQYFSNADAARKWAAQPILSNMLG